MAKRTGSLQGSTAEKKQKTSHSAASLKRMKPDTTLADEDLRSPFTVQELFQRVPPTIVEEIFDYLDVRQVKRLSKHFPDWTTTLARNIVRSRGIAFLEKPTWRDVQYIRFDLKHASASRVIDGLQCPDSPLLGFFSPESIKHFVFIGTAPSFNHGEWDGVVAASYETLKKLTYVRNRFDAQDNWGHLGRLAVPTVPSIESITVRNCSVRFQADHWTLNQQGVCSFWQNIRRDVRPFSRKSSSSVAYYMNKWTMEIRVPFLQIRRTSSGEDDSQSFVLKYLDSHKLIWPYPEEQLQWLLGSLGRLDGTVLQAVKDADTAWQLPGSIYFMDNYFRHFGWKSPKVHLATLDLTTPATSDDRMLSNLDLAFLGRLLVAMDKLKPIPGFQPPPFPFPDAIHFSFATSRR